jgi:hypothetical protein
MIPGSWRISATDRGAMVFLATPGGTMGIRILPLAETMSSPSGSCIGFEGHFERVGLGFGCFDLIYVEIIPCW